MTDIWDERPPTLRARVKLQGDLPKEAMCIHKPELNWIDLKEAINRSLKEVN